MSVLISTANLKILRIIKKNVFLLVLLPTQELTQMATAYFQLNQMLLGKKNCQIISSLFCDLLTFITPY